MTFTQLNKSNEYSNQLNKNNKIINFTTERNKGNLIKLKYKKYVSILFQKFLFIKYYYDFLIHHHLNH
jgi:hypothetical protein